MSNDTRQHLIGHLFIIAVFMFWFGSDLGVALLQLCGVG